VTAYVLDANVAAKWFLPPAQEPLVSEALQILHDLAGGRTRLVVPDLFWPEFGNVQWKAVRAGRVSQRAAKEAIAAMDALAVATAPSRPLMKTAFDIATAFERSVYDGVYVALAVSSGAPLLTADERLVNAVGSRFPVRWLGAFQ